MKIKQTKFRIGDIVKNKNGKIYVVCGTKGWVHKNGQISLAREIGAIPLLASAKEYTLIEKREKIKNEFWKIFPEGEI